MKAKNISNPDNKTPEQIAAAQQEEWIQQYAKHLEELKVRDPDEYKRVIDELRPPVDSGVKVPGTGDILGADGVKRKANEEGIEVVPEPGMVIKTKNIETGTKIFINICQSDAINPPSNRSQLDENGVEQEGVHVPISLGPKMKVKDNKGVDSHAYDFIVNPKVVKDTKDDKTGGQRHFLVQLCMQYVYNKYKEQCDQKYKILVNTTYMGTLPPQSQRVRKRQAPKIEEVTNANPKPKPSSAKTEQKKRNNTPIHFASFKMNAVWKAGEDAQPYIEEDEALLRSELGNDASIPIQVIVEIDLSEVDSANNILLESGPEMFMIQAKSYYRKTEIFLPYPIDVSELNVLFNAMDKVLTITANVDLQAMHSIETEADPGSKPWLLHYALSVDSRLSNSIQAKKSTLVNGNNSKDKIEFAEDKFHLKFPEGVDPSSGVKWTDEDGPSYNENGVGQAQQNNNSNNHQDIIPDEEEEAFPEDKFHKADFISQHLMEERRMSRQKKEKEADGRDQEREKEEQMSKDKEEADKLPEVEHVPLDKEINLSTSNLAFDLLD